MFYVSLNYVFAHFTASQADYLQPKLLGILAFFNMQLLSSSAGEKDHKKLVRDPPLHFITDKRVLCLNSSRFFVLRH